MVDKKLIQDTITELMDANVDKDTIFSTLRDIGVDEGEIQVNYTEIYNLKKGSSSASQKVEPKAQNQEISFKTNQSVPEKTIDKQPQASSSKLNYVGIEDISSNKHEEELKDTATEIHEINEKQDAISAKEELNKLINTPTSKLSVSSISQTSDDNKIIAKQISELEAKVDDIKAELAGLTKIMKDILEENRNILNKL